MRLPLKSLVAGLGVVTGMLAGIERASGQNWVGTTAPALDWNSIVESGNGTNLAAASGSGDIYWSANSGIKWTRGNAPRQNWGTIAGSGDGKKLVAGAVPGPIATSTDFGATWTNTSAPPTNAWFGVASSADGTRLAAVADRDGVFTSADSGASWNKVPGLPEQQWFAIGSSADGMVLAAAGEPGLIYVSTDGGQTWGTNNAPLLSWSSIEVSADGTRLAAAAVLDGIYISTNSGAEWTRTSATNDSWSAVAGSADGTQLIAAGSHGIYVSTNGGAEWRQIDGSQRTWTAIACEADGSNPFATTHGGIYAPITSPAAAAGGSLEGVYQGLFYDTNGIAFESAGFFSATVRRKSAFSAKLRLAGRDYLFSGRFSGGASSNSIARTNAGGLNVELRLSSLGDALEGTVSTGTWTAELTANRATFSKTNSPPQHGKKYTMAMSATRGALVAGDEPARPGGIGFGSLVVNNAGNITFAGRLDDGTAVLERTFVSKLGQWPLYSPLYRGKGLVIGWLTFLNQARSDLGGAASWIKLSQPKGKFYPAGFTVETDTIGSTYRVTNNLPVLSWREGQVVLVGTNILGRDLTNHISLNPTNTTWDGGPNLRFKLNAPSGSFKGTAVNPATGKPVVFSGVILQKQGSGIGYFPGKHQTGVVLVQAAN